MYLIIPTILVSILFVLPSLLHLTIYIVFLYLLQSLFCCPQGHWATDTSMLVVDTIAISGSAANHVSMLHRH